MEKSFRCAHRTCAARRACRAAECRRAHGEIMGRRSDGYQTLERLQGENDCDGWLDEFHIRLCSRGTFSPYTFFGSRPWFRRAAGGRLSANRRASTTRHGHAWPGRVGSGPPPTKTTDAPNGFSFSPFLQTSKRQTPIIAATALSAVARPLQPPASGRESLLCLLATRLQSGALG